MLYTRSSHGDDASVSTKVHHFSLSQRHYKQIVYHIQNYYIVEEVCYFRIDLVANDLSKVY